MKDTGILGIRPKRLKTFIALKTPSGKWSRQGEEECILLMRSRMERELGKFSVEDVVVAPFSTAIRLGQVIEYQILNTSPMEKMLEHNTAADPKLYKLYAKAYMEIGDVCRDLIEDAMERLFGKGRFVPDKEPDMTGVQI